ncbi:MAG: PilZ domain-containing protein [Nitrospiraceae bacterium]
MELRKFPRFRVQFRSTFTGHQIEGEGKAIDLSQGGCRIESDLSIPASTTLELRLYVPELDWPLRVEQAVVKWARGREVGLEFVRILPDEEKTLHRVVKDLNSGEPE